jgi:2-oxoglutarate ferredoxin oxidoreductase subunit alpha
VHPCCGGGGRVPSALQARLSNDGVRHGERNVNALRVRSFPFQDEIADFVASHPWVFVVEQNRDAQLKTLLVNEAKINPAHLLSVLHYDGTPITARFIVEKISQHAAAHTVVPLKKVVS